MDKISIEYQPRTIVHITSEHIDLQDDHGSHHRLWWQECARAWAHYVKTSPDFNVDTDATVDSTCVAFRHGIVSNLYIEFIGNPTIRLKFKRSWRVWNPKDAFDNLKRHIQQLGWTTYDMS